MTSIHDLQKHGQLSIGYQSYGSQTYSIKTQFFQSNGHVHITIWMHHMDAKCIEKKLDGNRTRMQQTILNKS